MTMHTPGPWKIGRLADSVISDHPIPGMPGNTGHGDAAYYGGHLIAESILSLADRKLIAAAPDLLAALKEFLSDWDGFSQAELERRYQKGFISAVTMTRIAKGRAAIAKAEGRS